MNAPLADVDPDIAELLDKELGRQRDTLEMIVSENFAPRSVLQLQGSVLTNKAAEDLLHGIGITVNRNAVPNDPRPPMVTSGLRIGTSALAARGFGDAELTEVADIIATALAQPAEVSTLDTRVRRLASGFALYDGLEEWELHGRP
jgi:glycine hydroxymethyltransferase